MRWFILTTGVLSGLSIALSVRQRRLARFHAADLVPQIRSWYAKAPEGDEPAIKVLELPAVRPLKAVRGGPRKSNLERFADRLRRQA